MLLSWKLRCKSVAQDEKIQLEKEEKARIKAEKKRLKELKRKEREEKRNGEEGAEPNKKQKLESVSSSAASSTIKSTTKSSERRLALLQEEHRNPPTENLKQAWDASYRNKAVSALLRFGFARFAKVRHESGLQSLPLQDIEIFCRSRMYRRRA